MLAVVKQIRQFLCTVGGVPVPLEVESLNLKNLEAVWNFAYEKLFSLSSSLYNSFKVGS